MSLSAAVLVLVSVAAWAEGAGNYFAIEVVDDQTGRGVPLVELRTVDQTRYVTDSRGLVALNEPGLMGQSVFFHVRSHGYEFPADGFGYRGKALQVEPGGQAQLRLQRTNVAERLYRVTGGGIYRDSVLLGRDVPLRAPTLNAQVAGSDSVNTVLFHDRVYWFWGDTNRLGYPLGLFHVPGAVSRLPKDGGLDPARGVDLEYFTRDDGFVAATCEMPGEGPTWIDGVCVIRDPERGERLFAKYVKVRKFLEVYERGLVEFNDQTRRFEKVATFDFAAPLYPFGHAQVRAADGTDYVYFGNPFPVVRVAAKASALADPKQYEAFTPLVADSRLDKPKIERDAQRAVRYGWKRNTPPPATQDQARWIKSGLLKESEGLLALREEETGRTLKAHSGSVTWNAFRRRWVMIFEELEGTSHLGEIWYAEADTPLGPWVFARKIVTHDKYSFYNPKQHAMFDADGGRRIFFEGTYSTFFAGNDDPTPRYDYNQIMYALDLTDARLALPVPVYSRVAHGAQSIPEQTLSTGAPEPANAAAKIVFMALDRQRAGAVPLQWRKDDAGAERLHLGSEPTANDESKLANGSQNVAFYALAADSAASPKTTVLLYEWRHAASGRRFYTIEGEVAPRGYVRAGLPLCRVWRYPLTATIAWQ